MVWMKMNRLIKQAMIGILVIPFAVSASGTSAISDPTPILVDVDSFYLWRTATGGTMRVEWVFPPDATAADLVVTGRTVNLSIRDITDEFADVELPVPVGARDEDVIAFTLSFNDGTVKTASLGLVRGKAEGAGITTSTECLASKASQFWKYAKKHFVVPVPLGAESLMVSGESIDVGLDGAAGWFALGPYSRDTVLSLSADESSCELLVTGTGLVINFR
jgi:hypothetical protein